jgi:hypothetical protein
MSDEEIEDLGFEEGSDQEMPDYGNFNDVDEEAINSDKVRPSKINSSLAKLQCLVN